MDGGGAVRIFPMRWNFYDLARSHPHVVRSFVHIYTRLDTTITTTTTTAFVVNAVMAMACSAYLIAYRRELRWVAGGHISRHIDPLLLSPFIFGSGHGNKASMASTRYGHEWGQREQSVAECN